MALSNGIKPSISNASETIMGLRLEISPKRLLPLLKDGNFRIPGNARNAPIRSSAIFTRSKKSGQSGLRCFELSFTLRRK